VDFFWRKWLRCGLFTTMIKNTSEFHTFIQHITLSHTHTHTKLSHLSHHFFFFFPLCSKVHMHSNGMYTKHFMKQPVCICDMNFVVGYSFAIAQLSFWNHRFFWFNYRFATDLVDHGFIFRIVVSHQFRHCLAYSFFGMIANLFTRNFIAFSIWFGFFLESLLDSLVLLSLFDFILFGTVGFGLILFGLVLFNCFSPYTFLCSFVSLFIGSFVKTILFLLAILFDFLVPNLFHRHENSLSKDEVPLKKYLLSSCKNKRCVLPTSLSILMISMLVRVRPIAPYYPLYPKYL